LGAGCGPAPIHQQRLARTQIEGGVVQGIGYALYEERRLCPQTGVLLTRDLEHYHLVALGDAPEIDVVFDEKGFPGMEGYPAGLAELCTIAPAAAIANAVYNATAWRPDTLPIRPDRVMAGVKA
jgi:xanthine dehydrogenase YagR molybdenum-binding subunit